MTTPPGSEQPADEPRGIPEPQGHVAGVPYDLRRPTVDRNKARYWSSDDHRLFTPKVLGAGWTVNFYWVLHPVRYMQGCSTGH